jgi:hypothetical protein
VASFTGAAFGTVRVVRERRGVCYCMLPLDEKSTLFFLYFMGCFEGSGKGRQTDPALAHCRRC